MKKITAYILFFLVAGSVFFTSCRRSGRINMRETYGAKDFNPYGGYVFYQLLKQSYKWVPFSINKQPFQDYYYNSSIDSATLYVCLAEKLKLNADEVNALSNFIYEGNSALIAASQIDTGLLSKFGVVQQDNQWLSYISGEHFSETGVRLRAFDSTRQYSFFASRLLNFFPETNKQFGKVLGYNESKQANFTMIAWGKGRLYLHCEPRTLSNYFLLTRDNNEYARQILKWMYSKPGSIVWDDYYHKMRYSKSGRSLSTLATIMQYPAIAAAFWIMLALLLLYIAFEIKRRQRIIPVLSKPVNSSIEFTEAIARLYLLHKDNKNIADKMITYFHEFIRTNYFISINEQPKELAAVLSKKSGVPAANTEALVSTIRKVQETASVDDETLLALNNQIQTFYKKRT